MLFESADRLMTARGTVEQWRGRRDLPDGLDPAGWAQFAELGWLALPVPEDCGGLGGSIEDVALMMTALGKGLAIEPYVSTAVLCAHIVAVGAERERTAVLEAVAGGTIRLALAHNEIADRFDIASPRATVAQSGPDGYVLNGAKTIALDAPSAHRLLVSATVALLAQAVGSMKACLAICAAYLKERRQFGQPIGKFQSLQHVMADMLVAAHQARSILYQAIVAIDGDAATRTRVVSAAKIVAGEAMQLVSRAAIQLHGGYGLTDEYAVGHHYRRLT